MQFQKLRLCDLESVKPYLAYAKTNTCDFTVGGIFMWRNYFQTEFSIENGTFYSRLVLPADGKSYYNLPLGENIPAAIAACLAFSREQGEEARFLTIPEAYLPLFEAQSAKMAAEEHRDYEDYLYQASDLCTLSGKKYSGQRNQINKFHRSCEDWEFCEISLDDTKAVRSFFDETYLRESGNANSAVAENSIVPEVLDNMALYGMFGGCLLADGKIVGFSLGERVGDTVHVHIEKADRDFPGAYQMIVNQFSLRFASNATYINRQDDMGDAGLRTAKEAYHPLCLLKKYTVTLR